MNLQIVYIVVVSIAFIVSLLSLKYNEPYFKVFTLLLFVIIIVETSGYTIKNLFSMNNRFLFHIYGPVEYLCIAYAYYSSFISDFAKKMTLLSMIIFIAFSIFSSIYLQTLTEIPYNFLFRCLLIIGLVLYYFYELYRKDEVVILTRLPMFWVSVGNFFFYSGNYFLMGFMERLEKIDIDFSEYLFQINTGLNIFLYTMFMIGFICKRT